ncbi:Proteasome assembly chaperone 2 [Chytriomyces hyalinus]|nr:Proteasome assembly chaperone 2 [Chytriomyces hyalinus]
MLSNFTKPTASVPLILSAPLSIGNVGALSLDMLVANTSGAKRVAVLQSAFVAPLVCADAVALDAHSQQQHIACALELYQVDNAFCLQMRSPIRKGHAAKFTNELIAWIKEMGFSQVILLTSFDMFKRTDTQIQSGSLLRFFSSLEASSTRTKCEQKLGWTPLEPFNRPEEMKEGDLFPPESGLCQKIYDGLVKDPAVECLVLSWFAPADGFHFQHATGMAKALNELLDLGANDAWKLPYSWHEAALSSMTATSLYT